MLMFFMIVSEFGDERRLIRRGNRTPLIKEIKHAQGIVVDKLNDFKIVWELNFSILVNEPFLLKDLFLLFEDFVEVNLMKSLVCVVDKQLFQTIWLKDFESVNVQKS